MAPVAVTVPAEAGGVVPLLVKAPPGSTKMRLSQAIATNPNGDTIGELYYVYFQADVTNGNVFAMELYNGIPDGTNVTITAT